MCKRQLLVLVLGFISICSFTCVEDGVPVRTESELLAGTWLISSDVAPVEAVFTSDGRYTVTQDFGSTPFVQEGGWSFARPHVLVQSHKDGRSTETVFVGETRLVVGGVLLRLSGGSQTVAGTWETIRVVETIDNDGGFLLSSHTTRAIELRDGGSGTMVSTTLRADGTQTGETSALSWQEEGGVVVFNGGLTGEHTLIGDVLAPLGNGYERVGP